MERKQCEASNNFFLYWLCCYLKKGEHYKSVGGKEKSHYYRKHLAAKLEEVQRSDKDVLSEIRDSGVSVCYAVLFTTAALMILLKKLPLKKKNHLKYSMAQPKFIVFL